MERGDIVYCLNPGLYPLTAGRPYQVLQREDEWIMLRGDSGVAGRYSESRFKRAEDSRQGAGRTVERLPELAWHR